MKSFIPWIGGKSLLAKKIVEQFPDDIERYIEVFGGGGSVLLYKENHAKLEVYNDFNSDLVNLFRCAKYHRAELQREISGYFNSREIFDEIKKKMKLSGFTDIQRAAMFFVMVRLSFGSNIRTFGGRKRNLSPDYLEEIEKRLLDDHERLKAILFYHIMIMSTFMNYTKILKLLSLKDRIIFQKIYIKNL